MAVADWGGFAQEMVVPAVQVWPVPDTMSDIEAGGFPIIYGTSHLALTERARLRAGETLLVHGAAGGVGLAAVEIGKKIGATVIAVAGGADKLAVARRHGADHVLDHGVDPIRERVKELTGGRGADVVFDPVGGNAFDTALRCIAWDGRIIVIGFASGLIPQVPANILLVKHISVMGFYWGSYRHSRTRAAGGVHARGPVLVWRRGASARDRHDPAVGPRGGSLGSVDRPQGAWKDRPDHGVLNIMAKRKKGADEAVRDQYEAYPYPARDPRDEAKRLITGSPSRLAEVNHYVFGGRMDFAKPLRGLVAGGGTGDATVMIAQQSADAGCPAEIVHLEPSDASRKVAEARIAARKLGGVRFAGMSLLDLPGSDLGPFDYIDCCGVLHHLDDPAAGLKAPDGRVGARRRHGG